MKIDKKKLALFGGSKVIKYKFKPHQPIGKEELKAATRVIKSGNLSSFVAGQNKRSYYGGKKNFYGGKYTLKFENYLKNFYKVKNAIVLNSWTSGIIAALGAIDINPGDEIITTPWTMCATATSILHWNAIPVFADIDKNNFCIDPEKVKKKITKRTVAILAVDIFGQSCDLDNLKKIIKGTKIKIITDSAQSPFSFYKNKITGTKSDIGGFSLNCHKHINTGEGGIVVTNDDKLAEKVKLLRNHAESSMFGKKKKELPNMLGYNFRMGEIEAAIGIEQYKKLKNILKKKHGKLQYLNKKLSEFPGIRTNIIKKDITHNYYVLPIVLDLKIVKYSRQFIVNCLEAEGVQGLSSGYDNLHMYPIFQNKIAYGKYGFPWSISKKNIIYKRGICPIAEELHNKTFIAFGVCAFDLSIKDIKKILIAFEKVWKILKII